MIRRATHADIEAIARLVLKAWAGTITGDLPKDPSVLRRTIRTYIDLPQFYIRVLELDGALRGLIAGVLIPEPGWCGDVAVDQMFYVEPLYRGHGKDLLDGFLSWAFRFNSVRYVWLQISCGGEDAARTERFYQRLGFERTGASFIVRRKT